MAPLQQELAVIPSQIKLICITRCSFQHYLCDGRTGTSSGEEVGILEVLRGQGRASRVG